MSSRKTTTPGQAPGEPDVRMNLTEPSPRGEAKPQENPQESESAAGNPATLSGFLAGVPVSTSVIPFDDALRERLRKPYPNLTALVDDVFAIGVHWICKPGQQDNGVNQTVFAETPRGVETIILPWENAQQRDIMAAVTKRHLVKIGATRYVLLSEMWMVETTADDPDTRPPSAREYRQEGLTAQGHEKGVTDGIAKTALIVTNDAGKRTVDEPRPHLTTFQSTSSIGKLFEPMSAFEVFVNMAADQMPDDAKPLKRLRDVFPDPDEN